MLILYQVFDTPGDADRKIGLFLGLIACAGIAVGGYLSMQEDVRRRAVLKHRGLRLGELVGALGASACSSPSSCRGTRSASGTRTGLAGVQRHGPRPCRGAVVGLSVAVCVLFRHLGELSGRGLLGRRRLRRGCRHPDRDPADQSTRARATSASRFGAWLGLASAIADHHRRLHGHAAAEGAERGAQPPSAAPTSPATWVAQAMMVIIGLTPTEVGSRLASAT